MWPLKVTGASGGGYQPARLQFWPGATSLADLADARAGTLTTRTGDDTGAVTFGAGHGFVTGDLVDLKWAGGERREMSTTVAGIAVTLDGGTGDTLPVATTAVTATADDAWILLVGSQTFEAGDRPLGLVVGMKEDGRPVLVAPASGASGTGLTVRAADGDPSFPGTTTLEFNDADGFILSRPAPGVSRVGLSVADSVLSRLCVVKDCDGFITDLQYVNAAGACVPVPECADTGGACGSVTPCPGSSLTCPEVTAPGVGSPFTIANPAGPYSQCFFFFAPDSGTYLFRLCNDPSSTEDVLMRGFLLTCDPGAPGGAYLTRIGDTFVGEPSTGHWQRPGECGCFSAALTAGALYYLSVVPSAPATYHTITATVEIGTGTCP